VLYALGLRPLSGLALAEGCFPAPLQFHCYEAIIGIDAAKVAFTERCVIPQPLELLPVCRIEPLGLLALRGHRLGRHIECER